MKIKFRQHTKSGCGSHCLANFFNRVEFLEGIETLETGEFLPLLNKKLEKIEPDFYITTLFLTSSYFKNQHDRLMSTEIFDVIPEAFEEEQTQSWARPLLVSIKGSIRNHYILVLHNIKDGLIYIFDSLREERQVMKQEDFIQNYHVLAVDTFARWTFDSPDISLFINKKHFPHLFNEGE